MELLVGIDIGTTNVKVAAYTFSGCLVGEASHPTPVRQTGLRQAEIVPADLWQITCRCITELTSQLDASGSIAGLAVASVGEAGIPVDARGEALFPIIAWYDERTVPQAARINQLFSVQELYRITGLPPGHTYTLHKLLWLKENHQAVLEGAAGWLAVCDWIAVCMGAVPCMGYSQASRTLALDLARRCWWLEGLSTAGLSAGLFPHLVAEGSRIGSVSEQAARLTGLQRGTPIYLAGHDHVCGALAVGVIAPGVVLDSTGTTEAELTTISQVSPYLAQADLAFCLGCHVVRDTCYATGGILGAGSLLNWLAGILFPDADPRQAVEALSTLAGASPHGAHGLYLLPHLAGAGSPDRSSTARGVAAGLSLLHSRADIARAAFEGLAFELRVLWDALERFTGQSVVKAVTVGGGARNRFWNQLKADITSRTLEVPDHSEAVTRGAALLAGIGAGLYHDAAHAAAITRQPASQVVPDVQEMSFYRRHWDAYTSQVRPASAALGRLSGDLNAALYERSS